MKKLLLLLALACAPYQGTQKVFPEPITEVDGTGTVERVVSWDGCLDIAHCRAFAPYWRPDDPIIGLGQWFISDEGHACLADPKIVTITLPRTLVLCHWRYPH